MADRKPHPSGRPIRRPETKGRQLWRVPDDGFVTPRLRQGKEQTYAVGFFAREYREDEED